MRSHNCVNCCLWLVEAPLVCRLLKLHWAFELPGSQQALVFALSSYLRIRRVTEEGYIYAYVAVAPELGEMTCLILPYANMQMMALFLKQVATEFQNYFIVMQVDRATWHTSKKLQIPENIRLLPQPAYSPELMPVEHIWDDIRRDYFPNRIVHSIDEVMDKLSDGLKQLASQPEKLRSLTYFPHVRLLI